MSDRTTDGVTEPAAFDRSAFDAALDEAVARCREITRAEARQFVEKGYVVIKAAFSRDIARAVVEQAWAELAEKHGVDESDPETWNQPFAGPRGQRGYARTAASAARFRLADEAPRAFWSQADLIGGVKRLAGRGETLAWSDAAIANLSVPDADWAPPAPRQRGWHKDGWHFRHFLGSPEQGLLTVPIFTDIAPQSGGTFIATDSIEPVARLLAAHPEGLHADSVQGGGYLIPGLIEQCTRFEELTGDAGDMALLHPYILHRVCPNPSPRPRFIANAALVLNEPMRFDRGEGDPYSLVELAVLRALGVNHLCYEMTRPLAAFVPGPFRNEQDGAAQRGALEDEMVSMAESGVVTPDWGVEYGYGSNRAEAMARR